MNIHIPNPWREKLRSLYELVHQKFPSLAAGLCGNRASKLLKQVGVPRGKSQWTVIINPQQQAQELKPTRPSDPVVHNGTVELVSNIVWLITALTLLSVAFCAVHNGRARLPMAPAMLATVMLCFILLPVISTRDDLLEARETALPLSSQTWRMASEGLTAGLDNLAAVAFCFLLIVYAVLDVRRPRCEQSDTRNFAEWLTRSQRLRPPPFAI